MEDSTPDVTTDPQTVDGDGSMGDSGGHTDHAETLGEIGMRAYYGRLAGYDHKPTWDSIDQAERDAWKAAAEAVAGEYDRSLYEAAEVKAQALGLEPMDLPDIAPPPNA